jgi:hypothetical protein
MAGNYIDKLLKSFRFSRKVDFRDILWLSLGENCLPDNILHRHGLKSFSTPYSHGRSNIDYALALEKNNYDGLLDPTHLAHGISEKKQVVRSTLFNQCDDLYNEMHMRGFEMTHHDVIGSEKDRDTFFRKISRQLEIRGKKKIVFFYHHRVNKNTDMDAIFKKAVELSGLYSRKQNTCTVIVFSQKIVDSQEERRVFFKKMKKKVLFFEFHTYHLWAGRNDDLFWARIDDDLIRRMIDTSVAFIKNEIKIKEGFI